MTGITYEIENRLVRGLDYYTRTVFEIVPPKAGSQSTLVAGGRYDGLMKELGGRPTPGIGFGMGIERVLGNLKSQEIDLPKVITTKFLITHVGDGSLDTCIKLASSLRNEGFTAVLGPSTRNLKSQLRYASSNNFSYALIIGPSELEKGVVVVRDLVRSEQCEVNIANLVKHLCERL